MLKVIKGKDKVLGIVMHEHENGLEVLFTDSKDEQLSWVEKDEVIQICMTSDEYQAAISWYDDFNLSYCHKKEINAHNDDTRKE